jgi:hypothetical protein
VTVSDGTTFSVIDEKDRSGFLSLNFYV